MKIKLICFSSAGRSLVEKISEKLSSKGNECEAYGKCTFISECNVIPVTQPLQVWTENAFHDSDAIIFVGAAGIAVRAIAPFVKTKVADPAIIVLDEKGIYSIPLLSGHMGGANSLAKTIAEITGAEAIITTATDINGKFSVDSFAEERGMHISSMSYAKDISAYILEKGSVGFKSDFPVEGNLPNGLVYAEDGDLGVHITSSDLKGPFYKTLNLIPKTIIVGLGCRKDTPAETIEELVIKVLKSNKLSIHSVKAAASIDLKMNVPGILSFCKKYSVGVSFFSKEELEGVDGDFSESSFVKSITGIGNVCERAALKASDSGRLIQKKVAEDGVTVALASEPFIVYLEK